MFDQSGGVVLMAYLWPFRRIIVMINIASALRNNHNGVAALYNGSGVAK